MRKIVPSESWKNLNSHYLNAVNDPWYKQLIDLQNIISYETAKFYQKEGFVTIHLPVTTGSISSPMGKGSDSSPVKINLHGVETYLADSMQFLLEYGCRFTKKGCYYLMPSFRGEKADERHLCQFYHSEMEMIGDLNDVMRFAEKYVRHLTKAIYKSYGLLLKDSIGDISHIEKLINDKRRFKMIKFNYAEKLLKNKYGDNLEKYIEYNNGWRNITRDGEKAIMEMFDRPVWITHYDTLAVPFYQKIDYSNSSAKNADLLMGIGETIGCGERHRDFDEVAKALQIHEVDRSEYEWYIDMKREYPLNTCGFGMGIERYLMWLLKCNDIRSLQICPRFNGVNIIP